MSVFTKLLGLAQPVNPYMDYRKSSAPLTGVNSRFDETWVHGYAKAHAKRAWGSTPIPDAWQQQFDAIFEQQRDETSQYMKGEKEPGKIRTVKDVVSGHAALKEKQRTELDAKLNSLFDTAPPDVKAGLIAADVKAGILREKKDLDLQKQKAFDLDQEKVALKNHLEWIQRLKGKSPTSEAMMGADGTLDMTEPPSSKSYDVALSNYEEDRGFSKSTITGNRILQMLDKRGLVFGILLEVFSQGTTQIRINAKQLDFDPRLDEAQAFVLNHIRESKDYPLNTDGSKSVKIDITLEEKPRRDGWGRLKDKLHNEDLQRFKKHAIDWLTNTSNRDSADPLNEKSLEVQRMVEAQSIMQNTWRRAQCGDPPINLTFTLKGKDFDFQPSEEDFEYVRNYRGELCEIKESKDVAVDARSMGERIAELEAQRLASLSTPSVAASSSPSPGGPR